MKPFLFITLLLVVYASGVSAWEALPEQAPAPEDNPTTAKKVEESVRVMGKTQLNKDLNDKQVSDIVAFLSGLTGEFPEQIMPRLPPTPGNLLE